MGINEFPYKVGLDLAGEVVAIGSSVMAFKPGDKVVALVNEKHRGTIAEYALSLQSGTVMKPEHLDWAEAASIPLAAMTALQAFDIGEKQLPGGLEGKTVYIAAGLSGTGSFACQLAKNVFGVGKVITTLSTGKIGMVDELLATGKPDQVVDYTREDVVAVVGKGTVDFMFDTQKETLSKLAMIKKGGMIVSISTYPKGGTLKKQNPKMPKYVEVMLNVLDFCYKSWMHWKGVKYEYLLLDGNGKDLERLRGWVEEGKIKPVVGEKVKMEDISGVRAGCQKILVGKGGVGKFVIEVD
jgi:NADPH:quinone reductase-like Zn-dependent oxidoreductase